VEPGLPLLRQVRAVRRGLAVLAAQREQWASIAERDTQHEHYSEAFGRLSAENATLRQRIRDIAAGQRTLEERQQAARSNNRFLDKRIAGLEAQLLAAEPRT
jgi:chromosome segregation ATPase